MITRRTALATLLCACTGDRENDDMPSIVSATVLPVSRLPRKALNPTAVPSLMAGGIWVPGEGVTDDGTLRWESQADEPNTFQDLGWGKPVATAASNGAAVWDLEAGGAYCSFGIPTPGDAIGQEIDEISWAGWFQASILENVVRWLWAQQPEGDAGNRFSIAHNNGTDHRIFAYISRDGDGHVNPGGMSKWNSGPGPDAEGNSIDPQLDWLEWNFIRATYSSSGENYQIGGSQFSTKLRVFVNEIEIAPVDGNRAGQFSAPQGGTLPDDPVFALAPSSAMFVLGAQGAQGTSSRWRGKIGPFYIARGVATSTQWRRVMAWRAPQ